jgi:hypothetical protein
MSGGKVEGSLRPRLLVGARLCTCDASIEAANNERTRRIERRHNLEVKGKFVIPQARLD